MARLATTLALISALVGSSVHAQDATQDTADAALSTTLDDSGDTDDAPPYVAPVANTYDGRVACVIRLESHGDPDAVNPRSGASGLGQFLHSTWLTTPQGKAGLSVFDPVANMAAIYYMFAAGRAAEFDAVRIYGC